MTAEKRTLIIFEVGSIPEAYKALDENTQAGLKVLEFYPHAQGVRILFEAPAGYEQKLPSYAQKIEVSMSIMKAMLSQTGHSLNKKIVIAEGPSFTDIVKLAIEFDFAGAQILELRSLRANSTKNYAIFTLENAENCPKKLKDFAHTVLDSSNPALKEFFGFN